MSGFNASNDDDDGPAAAAVAAEGWGASWIDSGVLVLDSFRRIRSFNMSEHGEWAVFRVMSGELRRSCFCFNRDRSFKFGSDTKKVQIIKNRTL